LCPPAWEICENALEEWEETMATDEQWADLLLPIEVDLTVATLHPGQNLFPSDSVLVPLFLIESNTQTSLVKCGHLPEWSD